MRKRINITLNDTTYDKIKVLAEADRRSISNKIECILEDYTENKKPTTTLSYPPGVKGIPEQPYTVTATAGYAKPIATAVEKTPAPSNVYPATWLREREVDPLDTSYETYELFSKAYPERSYEDFKAIQARRASAYKPDPTDPYDPMTNNPYCKHKKSVIG